MCRQPKRKAMTPRTHKHDGDPDDDLDKSMDEEKVPVYLGPGRGK